MNLIVDASIAIKWFVPEIYWEHAARLQHSTDLHAPDFMLLECANILTKKVRRREVTRPIADEIQQSLLYLPVQLYPWQDLLLEANAVAHATYRSVYDCLYLVLARQLEGQMVTADKKLYLALETDPEWAKHLLWVEDIAKT